MNDDATLREARAWLRSRLNEGAACPCCTQRAQTYRRSISARMVLVLIEMVRQSAENTRSDGWFHVQKEILARLVRQGRISPGSGDYSKLRHWDLLEPHPENAAARPEKSSAGLWRTTPKGRQFVLYDARVVKYVHVFDNRVMGVSGPDVDVVACLGESFHFVELIAPSDLERLREYRAPHAQLELI